MSVTSKPITIREGKHNSGWKNLTPLQRFEGKYIPEPNTGCWLWLGALNERGYGKMMINYRKILAHRFAYQTFKGPLLARMELDHLCRVRCCVNPDHLEQVDHAEKVRRGAAVETHCKWGHPWDEKNTWMNGKWRFCRACNNARQKETQKRRKMKGTNP